MQFIKSYLTNWINTYIAEYFDNVSKDQITTQLSKGQIQLNKLQFKPFIFKKFNIPLTIKESMINNISITFGKQCSIKINTLYILIEILNLDENFIMESAIKLQILDKFKNSLIQNLLQAITTQVKQQQGTDKKFIFNQIQNIQFELTNLNITIVDKYCTKNSFGITLQNLTCKSSPDSQSSKLRKIDIENLQLFWQDTITKFDVHAKLEDIAQQNSDLLSFSLKVEFNKLFFSCTKVQCNSIYNFSKYISKFKQNQQIQKIQKKTNNEDDEKVKAEIKKILTSIPLSESSIQSEAYYYLCQLVETQSINDLQQIQFEILKYDKYEEILEMQKKNIGLFGRAPKNDKRMEEKIISSFDTLEQNSNIQQQYLQRIQFQFELSINQCEIDLSSIYRNQLNELIINFKNVSMLIIKNNQLNLDFTIKQVEVHLKSQDKTNYLISKNTNFDDRDSLELHHISDDKKERLVIKTCPFQILLNQEAFQKYYDLFYFFVASENQIPRVTKKAKEQIQAIVNDQKEKDINFKFEKVYIISTNGKETFLFSPGSIDFNYNTQNSSQYQIKISETTFGFSEKISSCIDFINQEYVFNSVIISRDFITITKCDINLVIKVQDNQINSILELNDLNFLINPMIYKYLYQFYGTHFQQPLKELKNQLRSNEENQHIYCYFHNSSIKSKIKCRLTFQQNFLNLYEDEKDEKFMKIDLQNMQYQTSSENEYLILELQTKKKIIWLDFSTNDDRQIVINKCQIFRDNNYYVQNILKMNGDQGVNNLKAQEQSQQRLLYFELKLNSIQIEVLENQNQPFLNIQLTKLNYKHEISELQQNITLKFNWFTIIRDLNTENFNFQEKNLVEIQNDQEPQNIIEYSQKSNEESTLKLHLPYCFLSYRAKIIGQILEQYPIQIQKDWNIKKVIINFYLTQYPDLQIMCKDMNIQIKFQQILFKQNELKQIEWKQNYISIMFPQDSINENCLQFKCIPSAILKVQNQKEITIDISLKETQALFSQPQTLQISKLKKNQKMVLLSLCDIFFNWQLLYQDKVTKNLMNFKMTQLKIILGAKVISYILKQMEKLSQQITDFYNSHDYASYLIQNRANIYSLSMGIETQIQAVIIDDLFSQSQPLFGIILKQPLLTLQLNQNDIDFSIRNLLELYYYHSIKLAWEPIIEPIYLEFILKISNQIPKISLEFLIQDICHINISTEFIQNLLKFTKLNQSFQLNQKVGIKQINQNNAQITTYETYETYEIYNFSGILIKAQEKNQKIIELSNLEKIHTKCKGLFQFDVCGIKIQNWDLQLQQKKVIEEKGFTLIIETIVDEFMNSSKTIISSNILIINLTQFPLQIKISEQNIVNLDSQNRFQQFQKFQKYPNILIVPNPYQVGDICLLEKDRSSECFNYQNIAKKLLKNKDNSQILSINNKFFRLKCVHDPLMKERSIISIVPIVEFINQTPFKIRINKHCSEDKQSINFTLIQNEIVQDYQTNPLKHNQFRFTVDRYYQSIQYTFQELIKKNEVFLEDEKWQLNYKQIQGLKLLIQPKVDDQGRHQIIIQFNNPYLINNTKLDLIIYQGTEQNYEILGGQKYTTSYQLIALKTIFKQSILIFEERNSNLKTQPLFLAQIIKTKTLNIQKKENEKFYFLPILIEQNFIQMGDYTISCFKLCYRYLIFNSLAYKIQLCYNDKVLLLEPLVKTPLQIWNQSLMNDPCLPYECYLKIIIDDQVLETAKFNIMVDQQIKMIVRSDDLHLRKFLEVTILQLKGQYQLLIDEIKNQSDYPYMIINQSKFLQIQLKSDNQTLINGDRFPLAKQYQSNQKFTYLVNLKDQSMDWENSTEFDLTLDQVGLSGNLEINGIKYDYVVIQVDQQKQFIFKDFQILNQSQQLQQQECIKYILQLRMIILGCTISYIENQNYQCKELAICFLENIIIQYESNEQNYQKIIFKLQKLQIDAQSKTMSQEKTILFSKVQEQQNSIELEVRLDGTIQKCLCVDLVRINFGNLQFCMDQIFINKYAQIQEYFCKLMDQYFTQINNYLIEVLNFKQLQKKILKIQQTEVFVKKLHFCPVKIKMCYLKEVYQFERQQFVQNNLKNSPQKILNIIIQQYIYQEKQIVVSLLFQTVINGLKINPNKLTNWKKIRIKRALYEPMKIYKVFNEKQAQHYQILKQAKKFDENNKFSHIKLIIISTHNVSLKGKTKILYICEQQIFFIHQNLIQDYLEYDYIIQVQSQPKNLYLYIVCEKEKLTLLMEDESNLKIAIQNINRFQN